MSVKVLVSSDLAEADLERIRAVSHSFVVEKAATLDDAIARARDAEVIYAGWWSEQLWKSAPRLKWVQASAAGIESFLTPDFRTSAITLTNARGIYAAAAADHVMALVLHFSRQLNQLLRSQMTHRWEGWGGVRPGGLSGKILCMTSAAVRRAMALVRPLYRCLKQLMRSLLAHWQKDRPQIQPDELVGKTLGIVGLGEIGSQVAKRAKAFDMRVIAVRRRPELPCEYADEIRGAEELSWVLGESDFVALCAALTEETRHLIAEQELGLMKPTAYLINVGRGDLVDEKALVAALRDGRIAGAGLDVFEEEPLPRNSPLWDLPNVIITPHQAGSSLQGHERVIALFCENLRRYAAREPLLNVVDKDRGY